MHMPIKPNSKPKDETIDSLKKEKQEIETKLKSLEDKAIAEIQKKKLVDEEVAKKKVAAEQAKSDSEKKKATETEAKKKK